LATSGAAIRRERHILSDDPGFEQKAGRRPRALSDSPQHAVVVAMRRRRFSRSMGSTRRSRFENVDLEAAAETAARLKRWEFLLMAAPIRVAGRTRSPINPIAVLERR